MSRVKTFTQGGILVESHRVLTQGKPTRPLFLPSLAVVPLVQYPGAQAEWLVTAGETVAEDQLLARGLGPHDLPVHSPIPGRLEDIREVPLPWGGTSPAALIRLEGRFGRTGKAVDRADWTQMSEAALRRRIADAGILLESSPLDRRPSLPEGPLAHLIINGLQPEPYLTLASQLLEERPEDLAEGIRLLQKLLKPAAVHLAADADRPDPWAAVLSEVSGLQIHRLEHKYPQAQEGLLLKTIGLPRGQGPLLTLDAASVLALRDAVVEGKPQVERDVVVSGRGVRRPGTYRVRIGTPLFQLLKDSGGLTPGDHSVLVGGPFHGQAVENLTIPVLKSTQAVLVLEKGEVNRAVERPCIRCGVCVTACPVGLEPLNLHKALTQGQTALARDEGLDFCIECGICSFVCPSRIPLVSEFQAHKVQPSKMDAPKEARRGS